MVGKNNKEVWEEKTGQKVTRYSLRHLNVGIASVAIASGFLFFGGMETAQQVKAATVNPVETEQVGQKKDATAEDQQKSNSQTQTDTKQQKSAVETQKLNVKAITSDANSNSALNEDKHATSDGVNENSNKPVVQSEETSETGKDVSDELTNVKANFERSVNNNNETSYESINNGDEITPEDHGTLRANYSFDVPDDVKAGDSFTIKWSDNLNLYGTRDPSDNNFNFPDITTSDGEILAKAADTNSVTGDSLTYIFTDYVTDKNNIKASLSLPLFVDPKNVPKDEETTISTSIGSNEFSNKIDVKYTSFDDTQYGYTDRYGDQIGANGEAFITAINTTTHTITAVAYFNPLGRIIYGGYFNVKNNSGSSVNYNDQDTKVTVYKMKDSDYYGDEYSPNQSFYVDKDEVEDVTDESQISYNDNQMTIALPGSDNRYGDSSKYIIVYQTTYNPKSNVINTRTTDLTSDSDNYYYWDNYNIPFDPNSNGSGDQASQPTQPTQASQATKPTQPTQASQATKPTQPTQASQATKPTQPTQASQATKPTQPTQVSQATKPTQPTQASQATKPTQPTQASQATKPTQPTQASQATKPTQPTQVSQATKPTQPTQASQATKPTQPTQASQATTPTEEKGSFQEHDIYITIEPDDTRHVDSTYDAPETSGTKDEQYTTAGTPKEGYTFEKAENPVNNPTYKEDGSSTKGNYVAGEKQEITYVWIRKVAEPTQPQTSNPQPNTPVTTPKQPTQVTNVSQPSQPTQPTQKVKKNKTKKTTKKTLKKRNHKRYNNNFGPKGERYRNNHYNNNFAPHGERFTNMNNNIRPNGEGVNNGSISNAGVKSGSLNGENNKALPQTGEEHSNLLTAFGLGLASLAAIFGIALNRKHRKN